MSTIARIITAEELWQMPGNQRRELVKGEVRTTAPAGFDHGVIIDNLQFLLSRYVREKKLGLVVGAETGFRLIRNPDTVRGADIAFVSADRVAAAGRPIGYWLGAPDLAVEVLSPTDTVEEIEEKVDDYLTGGARMVWVVNPKRQSVTVHRPQANPVIIRQPDPLDGADVLPGFTCRLSEIFG